MSNPIYTKEGIRAAASKSGIPQEKIIQALSVPVYSDEQERSMASTIKAINQSDSYDYVMMFTTNLWTRPVQDAASLRIDQILTKRLEEIIKSEDSDMDKGDKASYVCLQAIKGSSSHKKAADFSDKMYCGELAKQDITNDQIWHINFNSIDGTPSKKQSYNLLDKRMSKRLSESVTYEERLDVFRSAIIGSPSYKESQRLLEEMLDKELDNPAITYEQIRIVFSQGQTIMSSHISDRANYLEDAILIKELETASIERATEIHNLPISKHLKQRCLARIYQLANAS